MPGRSADIAELELQHMMLRQTSYYYYLGAESLREAKRLDSRLTALQAESTGPVHC